MDLKPGDIVMLKSGGQAMTVAEANADSATCLWMGEDGDLFRETLPLAVLDSIAVEVGDDDDDEDEDDDLDDEQTKVA
ncbi:DUF2158 domain-containing protein [Rhodopseudomonas sp. BR0M22]|uniref:YodC family protein n=1 Tax=Rhodopseudomonas sp. BR0M22 TaxID=2269369 RepID=UPI0013DFA3C5|nr:DUF2158 domain-containing protein [Rhodopseudomonas sp. BR0M22]MCD0420170.1 YodC family protein [Rubrivivax sp. JA1024]NEW90936.1 DUF2158 domain-containing protein [Rhodopseudomonas sp. BR0M22]